MLTTRSLLPVAVWVVESGAWACTYSDSERFDTPADAFFLLYLNLLWLFQGVFPSLGYSGNRQELSVSGYSCPRCKTKTSELPSECVICALPLVRRAV